MDLVEVTEGATTISVPSQDPAAQFPPGTAPIFFNRRMELNRDATILLLPILEPSGYLDAMGASGIRGLRVANECRIPVTINDRDPAATELISSNAERLGLPVEATCSDINALLSERAFDVVDLDPFGTPAPFLDAGVKGTCRHLFITATDTAPLCGAHLRAGIRRYNAYPMNTEYHSEVGLRILLGHLVRVAAKYDRGLEPIFCCAREHFVRLHVRFLRGARAADRTLDRLGFVLQCLSCQYRREQGGMFPEHGTCPCCGAALRPIGPVWLGSICNQAIVEAMIGRMEGVTLGTSKELAKILPVCRDELPISTFYDYHQIAKSLRVSPPDIRVLIERLRSAGYSAGRTHFSGYGIKTDAPLEEIQHTMNRE
jgi:tRNA (guanine26-N2/guanine27-N2)-dimethyltransferase